MNFNITNVKICVTIPEGYTDKIRKAICEAGAGQIGTNYVECSNTEKCIGTFRPVNNANPFIGEKNKLEYVQEEKLEVICNVDEVREVVKVLRENHPYEEPAIDIYPLLDENSFK